MLNVRFWLIRCLPTRYLLNPLQHFESELGTVQKIEFTPQTMIIAMFINKSSGQKTHNNLMPCHKSKTLPTLAVSIAKVGGNHGSFSPTNSYPNSATPHKLKLHGFYQCSL
jgi:hypothetical protein